jgi:hypothetical protein
MSANEEEKQVWAETHARRIECRFEQWQKPLGIDGDEYLKYLTKELVDCCDDPLLKSLIESIA